MSPMILVTQQMYPRYISTVISLALLLYIFIALRDVLAVLLRGTQYDPNGFTVYPYRG